MEHYKAQHCSPLEAIVGIIVLAAVLLVVYFAGYHMGEFCTLRRYAEEGRAAQMTPMQIIPENEPQEIGCIQIHQPCRLYIELTE